MLALRYAAVLALVVWIGGLVALGALAAPAAFDVLGALGAEGRTLAGSVVGETLRRFNLVAYGCAGGRAPEPGGARRARTAAPPVRASASPGWC